jgi:ketosteroid isomerase-like protein
MVDAEPGRRHEPAREPNDLGRMLLERMNAGDIDGLVALYEPDAVLALPDGQVAAGSQPIRAFFEKLLVDRPTFPPGQQRPALVTGNLALTSAKLANGAVTAEVARRQPDGTWRWALDQPSVRWRRLGRARHPPRLITDL